MEKDKPVQFLRMRFVDINLIDRQMADSDVVVTVNPSHFRPAPDDHKAISRSKNCQIRVDCVQTRPIMNLLAPMAWAGLASWSVDRTTQSATKVTDLNANAVIDPKTGKQKIA